MTHTFLLRSLGLIYTSANKTFVGKETLAITTLTIYVYAVHKNELKAWYKNSNLKAAPKY